MNEKTKQLIQKLNKYHTLSTEEYEYLITNRDARSAELLKQHAISARQTYYSNHVFIRGLIEISNICKNDCLYCGIRRSNKSCDRYRLTKSDILNCCNNGYKLGFRTFVMQGGEDTYFSDDVMCDIISEIKSKYPDCAVTLSLGERSFESCKRMYDAGADRYLLRHETADREHYQKLHPNTMSFENRMKCLKNLKQIGYQTGCGFMVGSPYQTPHTLAKDLKFIEDFSPQMCGIGPFIPHHGTPFCNQKAGDVSLTLYLLSVIRLIKPNILLPATTALSSLGTDGRNSGMLCGANVVMPNLSPDNVRSKYELYNNKAFTGVESAEQINALQEQMRSIGFEIVTDRGDIAKQTTFISFL